MQSSDTIPISRAFILDRLILCISRDDADMIGYTVLRGYGDIGTIIELNTGINMGGNSTGFQLGTTFPK